MIFRPASSLHGSASRRPRGQGLTEYLVIVFLVAVGTIGVVGLFGDNLRQLFGGSAKALAGQESAGNTGSAPEDEVLRWSMKGGTRGNPGGATNRPSSPGGGDSNGGIWGGGLGGSPGGNPGGTTNSAPGMSEP